MSKLSCIRLILSGLIIIGVAGCRDKQPYPDAGQVRQALIDQVTRPAKPEPAAQPDEPIRLLALLHTSRGTTIVSGKPDGGSLSVRQVPGHAWVMDDGTLRVVRAVVRSARTVTTKKRSVMAGLAMDEYAPGGDEPRVVDLTPDLTRGWDETGEFLAEAVAADPDMAREFYHVEQMRLFGASGRWAVWLLKVESYMGGAHPSDSRRLIVVDMERGEVVDTQALFAGRDPAREVLGDRYEAACVRKVGGLAPFEGTGGGPVWAAMLTADFGVCEGQWEFGLVDPPTQDTRSPQTRLVLNGQSLERVGGGVIENGVVDFRTSLDGTMAIMEMGLGTRDSIAFPWTPGNDRGEKTREVRFLTTGMKRPAVISRLPDVYSVQFVPAGDGAVAANTVSNLMTKQQ